MAIWQTKFHLVPFCDVSEDISKFEDLDFDDYWSKWSRHNELIDYVLLKMEATPSWSKNILQFGSIEDNCIEILLFERKIEAISFRISKKNNDPDITKLAKELILDFDLLCLDCSGRLINNTKFEL
jgi:hypothetical protein